MARVTGKKKSLEPEYKITYKIEADGPNITGSGEFTITLPLGSIYRGHDGKSEDEPENESVEAVAAFLQRWGDEVGLYEVADDLEIISFVVTELDVEEA